jgi:hypothetical protein
LVERRVNALAIAWLVFAGLTAIGGFFGLIVGQVWVHNHIGFFGTHPGHHFPFAPMFPLLIMRFAWAILGLRLCLAIAAGWGLLQKAPWGRTVAIIAGCLSLLHFPFGTALGIWTLVVLLNAPNAAGYESMVQG